LLTSARPSLFLLLYLLSLAAGAKPVIEMELKAGIGGHAVIDQASEIKIRLFSSTQFKGKLDIRDATGRITYPVQLDEYKEKIIRLAVTPTAGKTVMVRLITEHSGEIEKQLTFNISDKPLTIISSTIPVSMSLKKHQQADSIIPLILAAQELPHNPQAYTGINALISNEKTLSRLSDKQYHALSTYLSRCGILLLSQSRQSLLKDLQNMSGCSGRFVHNFTALSQVTPILLKLHSEIPPKLPGLQDLMPLQHSLFQHQMITSLSLYLGGYVFFIALLSWRVKKTIFLLVLPVLAAAAGTLAWSGSASHLLISWAETVSGDNYSRVSSLLLLGGDRLGDSKINIAADTLIVNPGQGSQYPDIQFQKYGTRRTLNVHTQLLSPQTYLLTAIKPLVPSFTVKLIDNYPQVVFLGEVFPDKPRLLWRGGTYVIPILKKGKAWQPDKKQGTFPTSAQERLLNRRLAFDSPAVLLPIIIPEQTTTADSQMQSTSWMVIRHNPEQSL